MGRQASVVAFPQVYGIAGGRLKGAEGTVRRRCGGEFEFGRGYSAATPSKSSRRCQTVHAATALVVSRR
jgi:hypothetical protein